MITVPAGVRVYLSMGPTDMRKGIDGLSMLVQELLKLDPFSGHLFAFRGRRGGLLKVLYWDGQGFCLFAKRLDKGRFVWPITKQGVATLTLRRCRCCSKGLTGERDDTPGGNRSLADRAHKASVAHQVWLRRLFLKIIFTRMIATGAKQFRAAP